MGMDSIGLFSFIDRSFASSRSVGFSRDTFDNRDRSSSIRARGERDDD